MQDPIPIGLRKAGRRGGRENSGEDGGIIRRGWMRREEVGRAAMDAEGRVVLS